LLGLPLEEKPSRTDSPAPKCEAPLKKVRINTQEYTWGISTLESLLRKWRDACSPESFRNQDIRFLLVAVNDMVIPARSFSSMPISDGDEITIVRGAIAGG
jgi:sulfur carrier protein ThiS